MRVFIHIFICLYIHIHKHIYIKSTQVIFGVQGGPAGEGSKDCSGGSSLSQATCICGESHGRGFQRKHTAAKSRPAAATDISTVTRCNQANK